MKKSIIIRVIILVVLSIGLYFYSNKAEAQAPKSDDQIYLDKWNSIGELKLKEQKSEQARIEAKTAKDKLLEELNGTGQSKTQ